LAVVQCLRFALSFYRDGDLRLQGPTSQEGIAVCVRSRKYEVVLLQIGCTAWQDCQHW
jgi:hypothetical protein